MRELSEPDESWTPAGLAVLSRASAHYGGSATWQALRRIRLLPRQLSGLMPWLKGFGKTFHLPSEFEISPHERRARFLKYPDPEHVGVFDNGSVRIERVDGERVLDSPAHRRTFDGLAKYRRWQPIDALYFFGYALTHYHELPFTLSEARLLRVTTTGGRGERLDVLHVEHPRDLHTHGARQRYYFNAEGELVRHDYHAEILGFWAHGAHHWRRQTRVQSFPIALERHVVAHFGFSINPIVALHATFEDAQVELA